MRNFLSEFQNLAGGNGASLKIGTVLRNRPDGGFSISSYRGGIDVVYDTGLNIGETVLYLDGQVINKLKNETIKTYYIP